MEQGKLLEARSQEQDVLALVAAAQAAQRAQTVDVADIAERSDAIGHFGDVNDAEQFGGAAIGVFGVAGEPVDQHIHYICPDPARPIDDSQRFGAGWTGPQKGRHQFDACSRPIVVHASPKPRPVYQSNIKCAINARIKNCLVPDIVLLRLKALFPLLLSAFALAGPVPAQSLPMHLDPGARDDMVSASEVPALRFLTTDDFPPFNYTDGNGRLVGFHIDLANAICQRLGARCTIQAWPWSRVQDALADNQGDALIAGLDIGPDTAQRFDFSRIYLQLPARFVTRETMPQSWNPARMVGSVGVRAGSPHAILAQEQLANAQIVEFETEFDALAALDADEIDAVFADAVRASFWLNENPDCCAFAGEAYFRPDLFGEGFAVAVPAGLDNVRAAINWALVRLQREGRLDELYLRWFPVSFY